MNRYNLLFVPLVLMGCSLSQPPAGAARRVTGQLSSATLSRLDNPAIVLRTADGERRVVHVARTGEFKLDVPVGKSCHLSVASTTASGGLREDSTINWPHRWGRVDPGAPIALGVVRPRGQSSSASKREHDGEDDDDEGLDGGQDGDECRGSGSAEADLPYDAKLPLAATYKLTDSFLEKGPLPAKILSVTMEGGSWRLAELAANTSFTITQADCAHAGNRDVGRDRIEVKWQNADGSIDSDHLDLRYCDGNTAPSANAIGAAPVTSVPCNTVELCEENDGDESDCDAKDQDVNESLPGNGPATCAPPTTPANPPAPTPPGPGNTSSPCTTNADCRTGLSCFQSKCIAPVN